MVICWSIIRSIVSCTVFFLIGLIYLYIYLYVLISSHLFYNQFTNLYALISFFFSIIILWVNEWLHPAGQFSFELLWCQEKTGGKIIYRVGGIVYLFRGRNYDSRTRPKYPVMLWKPATPVYPKLIQEAPEGLTKTEADEMRKKGENLMPICKLGKLKLHLYKY